MADLATLFIKVDSKGVVTASKDLNKLTDDSKKAEKATDSVTSSFSKQIAIVKALAVAYGALKIAQYIKDATMLAARYETLGIVMQVVGNNAGFSGAQMEVFVKGLQKSGIAMIESRTTIIRMTQAQIDLTKSSELARIAQDAAVIGNLNSSESFERMIGGIQRGMPLILRTIGINVDFMRAYKDLARELGVNASELTNLQKIQARTNAVIQEGTKISGAYAGAMETAGKQVLSLKRHTDNLKVLLGEAFTPALAEIISQITESIKSVNGELSGPGAEAIKDWGNNFRLTILSIEAEIMRLAMFIDQVGGTLTSIGLLLTGPGALIGMIPGLEGFAIPFEKFADLNILLEERHNATGKALESLAKRYIELEAAMSPAGKAAKKLATEILENARMEAAEVSKDLKAKEDALAKIADIEKAYNEARIKAEEDYTDFWIFKAQERFEVQSRALGPTADPVDPVDPFDLVDQLAERASYYQDLIGFEDTYHEKMLELIKVRRQAEIDSGEDVAAANAKAVLSRNALAEDAFDNEIEHIQKQHAGYKELFGGLGQLYDKDSGARKALHQISIAFQLKEQAMMLVTMIRAAVIAVATQGGGDPYTAFGRVAAMAGLMASTLASAGVSFGGGGGGGGGASASRPASTVLGAAAGTGSESITKGWELLEDTYDMQFRELSGIHSEMKDLNDNITGLVTSIFRTGGLGVSGIKTGETIGIARKIAGAAGTGGLLTNMVSNFVGSIFGGATRTKITGSGISTGAASLGSLAEGGGIGGREFARVKTSTKGGLFSSSTTKFSTVYAALDEDVSRLLDLVFQNMSDTLIELTTGLGADMQATLEHIFPAGKINLKGMSSEEIDKALSEHFSALGDNAVDALFGSILRPYQQLGEGLLETATRILIDKAVVLDALDLTGQAFSGTIPQIIAFSEAIIGMAGNLETLHENAETFFNKFFSDEEKQLRLQGQLTKALGDLNLTLPTARDGYRKLVEGLDLTTDSGQRAFVSLLAVAGAADKYYSTLEKAATVLSTLTENTNSAIDEQIRQSSSMASAARSAALAYKSITNSLQAAIDKIRGVTGGGKAKFADLHAQAMTGDQAALLALPGAADSLLAASLVTSRTAEDFARDQGEVLIMLNDALLASTAETNWNEYQATLLEVQTEVLKDIKETLQESIVDTELLTQQVGMLGTIADLLTNQTGQIITGNATQSAIADISNLNTTYSASMLTALIEGLGTQGDSLSNILTKNTETVTSLNQLITLIALQVDETAAAQAAATAEAEAQAAKESRRQSAAAVREAAAEAAQAAVVEAQAKAAAQTPAAALREAVMAAQSSAEAKAQIEAARLGGFHDGGIAAGPESGYQATLHGTELVVSPNASFPATVRGGDSPGDRKLLERIATAIESGNFQIAKNTGKTSKILTRFDYDGMPAERTT